MTTVVPFPTFSSARSNYPIQKALSNSDKELDIDNLLKLKSMHGASFRLLVADVRKELLQDLLDELRTREIGLEKDSWMFVEKNS